MEYKQQNLLKWSLSLKLQGTLCGLRLAVAEANPAFIPAGLRRGKGGEHGTTLELTC